MEKSDFNASILKNMPYFLAVNYQLLLNTQSPQQQVKLILHIYNLGLRVLTINLVNQYLIRDKEDVDYAPLNRLLQDEFEHLTTGTWQNIFFTALEAYKGKEDLLFVPELHSLYWDATTFPHRERINATVPFDRLTQATLEQEKEGFWSQDEASWKARAEELMEHLKHILHSLLFFEKYDLIRVLDCNNVAYTFELHKGTQISVHHLPSVKHTRLTRSCFYLRTIAEDFLLLDPWLVFLDQKLDGDKLLATDIGVYDRIFYERLHYLLVTPNLSATSASQIRIDSQHVKEFIALVYDTIRDVKRDKTFILTWVELCNVSEKITKQQTATVQHKYQKDLYLQREVVRQEFESFLKDAEKQAFVLVGKSGVGKSNFLLALGEELQQTRKNTCVLIYDGASLRISSTTTITDIINQNFSNQLHFSGQQVRQVWQEIDKIDGMQHRQVILCIDAINENPEPTELLRQLDELVRESWPWLKIVLTSRPETWQGIKRGDIIKLAEKFYYRKTETLGVGESFNYSEQMYPFTRQELPTVYAKYQRSFQLQTPYESLSNELREILRDPLHLWLLAHTYKEKTIPSTVKTSALIQEYVNALDVRTLLQREDLQFLEKQLVPLMMSVGHYNNVITAEDLDKAGDSLYNMVFSNQVLSDGRPMNQSFQRLVEVDILVQQKLRSEHITLIQFKYERFYEHFIGKRIAQLSVSQTDRTGFFEEIIKEIDDKPFLWGAVRNALVQEGKEHGTELLEKLCFTQQQRVKEMLVNVLLSLALDERALVETLLLKLMPEQKQGSIVQKIPQFLNKNKQGEHVDVSIRNACKIAIEVASSLKLVVVLQRAALHSDPTIRTQVVRHSYYLWQHDREAGFAVLAYVAEKAAASLLPNVEAFESALGLSAIILFEHSKEQEILSKLQNIWSGIIAHLLRLSETSSDHKSEGWNPVRELFISSAIRIVFLLFLDLPAYGSMLNDQALAGFFRLQPAQKALYRKLVQYIDINGNYSSEQMEHDYLAALRIDNVLVSLTTLMGLTAHACTDAQNLLPFLKQLFEKANENVATYPYLTVIANVAMNVLYINPRNTEMFDFFVYTAETCQKKYTEHPETYHSKIAEAPQVATLGPYIIFQYKRENHAKTPWLAERIEAALSQNNFKFFELLLLSEFPQVALEQELPNATLEVLEMFFQKSLKNPIMKDGRSVLDFIIVFLARLRIRYPDEVDNFLEEQKAPEEIRLQVRTNEPVERVGDLIGKRSWFFLRDDIMLGSVELRSQLQAILEKAADSKDVKAWMNYNIRFLVNVIYGEQVLRPAKL